MNELMILLVHWDFLSSENAQSSSISAAKSVKNLHKPAYSSTEPLKQR